MSIEEIREQVTSMEMLLNPRCPICKELFQTPVPTFYAHLLEHRVRFLEKIIRLYCDCDCDKPPKPGEEHWAFCRRRLADAGLEATFKEMVPESGK